jgi:AcrR family transcriptional regulator
VTREAQTSQQAAGRRPGRPRSAEAHQAIIGAALEELLEHGFAGLSMERVAERAGVGKATIYRRWSSKSELVAELLTSMRTHEEPPDEGSMRADIRELSARQLAAVRAQPRFPRLAPRLLAESASDAELHAIVRENLVDPLRGILAELIERAIKRGEIRRDLDVQNVVDLIHGPIIYRFLLSVEDLGGLTEEYVQRNLDILIPGLAPRPKGGGRQKARG